MNDDTNDLERRKRQADAFRKFVEAGSVPPVLPQPQKYQWVISDKDRRDFAGRGIDLDK
jgi:hypothetical protein